MGAVGRGTASSFSLSPPPHSPSPGITAFHPAVMSRSLTSHPKPRGNRGSQKRAKERNKVIMPLTVLGAAAARDGSGRTTI